MTSDELRDEDGEHIAGDYAAKHRELPMCSDYECIWTSDPDGARHAQQVRCNSLDVQLQGPTVRIESVASGDVNEDTGAPAIPLDGGNGDPNGVTSHRSPTVCPPGHTKPIAIPRKNIIN